ncbi:SLOG family protein [Zongyangia hominis]|uniref:DUF2493 domain-containing protein n=1 Tax=Zongyangia hominis TaxID=2763677 RepID=A0A926EF85_9FIRM|nr:SLOG family protein [Zongyangia hominis]MBC8571384.1 DUF2493 domain-containing protein [Zongyangia hominis]
MICMKVAVIGSRSLKQVSIGSFLPAGVTQILSGGAAGVDHLAAVYAQTHGIPVQVYRPDYRRYGRGAPFVRNRALVDASDMVIAIWDGESRGTDYTIRYAQQTGKPVRLFRLKQEKAASPHCGASGLD